jgi:hypothetical protein
VKRPVSAGLILNQKQMKKIIFLLSFIIGTCLASQAQIYPFKSARSVTSKTNSFTNTAADTLDAFTVRVPAVATIQSTVTRATGTMAGKVYLYYAIDANKSYVLCDSASLSNAATNTTYFTKSIAAPYWRIIRNGATTVTGTSTAKISVSQ